MIFASIDIGSNAGRLLFANVFENKGTVVAEKASLLRIPLRLGIDVFEKEPLPLDHPLVSVPNVILTPHLAWYSKESTRDLQTGAAMEVKRVLSGQPPQNWANPWA